ncbi:hypothetical protein I6A60_01770 [Frankia sp. AgB1.9]|nr:MULTISPECIES: hypothetical protein [unclassified Frankia]MBL7546613.1 hypothetical protein [Frankia sp. AgB1.9]MBL7622401.1 hypothetical protein [Frankia sp. AgB1.8]
MTGLAGPLTETQVRVLAAAHDAQVTANGFGAPGWTSTAAARRVLLIFGRAVPADALLAALDFLAARGDLAHKVSTAGV